MSDEELAISDLYTALATAPAILRITADREPGEMARTLAAELYDTGVRPASVVASLHDDSQCDHSGCHTDDDCPESGANLADVDEVRSMARDHHDGPGGHDLGQYVTCTNALCKRFARILGDR